MAAPSKKRLQRLRRAASPPRSRPRAGARDLCVHRTPRHIYAQIISADGGDRAPPARPRSRRPCARRSITPATSTPRQGGQGHRRARVFRAKGITDVAFDRVRFSSTVASRRWPTPPVKAAWNSKGFNMAQQHDNSNNDDGMIEKLVEVNRVAKTSKVAASSASPR